MIELTQEQFYQVRAAVAGAHLLIQAVKPLLKQRQVALNMDERNLLEIVPNAVGVAFHIISEVTQRETTSPLLRGEKPTANVGDIDEKIMRNELENVSALVFPDTETLMQKALTDLPMFAEEAIGITSGLDSMARLLSWAWEAGRRYGVLQAIAVCDSTVADFASGTITALDAVLNATMELPPPELPFQPAAESNREYPSAETAENGDARSMGATEETPVFTTHCKRPN